MALKELKTVVKLFSFGLVAILWYFFLLSVSLPLAIAGVLFLLSLVYISFNYMKETYMYRGS